ncbi:MAG: hypothetical protein DMG35_08050 [Acidobacteria bacterium]|nr:MAG: hypothetical protein DMG35_08050 [Acidobacteriota bacterium]
MPRHKYLVWVLFILMLGIGLRAAQHNDGATLLSLIGRDHVLGLIPWSASGTDLICAFTKPAHRSLHRDSDQVTNMSVYRQSGTKLAKVFEIREGDSFLSAHPLQEDGRFLVTWVTGSAYHFQIFAYADGAVRKVLDTGSRSTPEVLFDDNGSELVLFDDMEMVRGEWRSSAGNTRVFKWNGREYERIGTVPWARRLQCLTKESCASLK